MNINFSEQELAFQQEVQTFFREELPESVQAHIDNGLSFSAEVTVAYQKALYKKGWAGINWPVEHGGTGWTPTQKYIFQTESAKAKAPRQIPFGYSMVAPIIYTFGNEEQKQRFLPDILASNTWWCQG